ncbi:MAG TPA: VWA domain-containing protein [Terriglobales bacterium]|nr:VWA domain-containing protein [Terriglobales bacterium]
MSVFRSFKLAVLGATLLVVCVSGFSQSVPAGMGSIVPNAGGENANSHEEPKVDLTSRTELVQVPVIVKDGSGAPIHGLKKQDFVVQENGKDQIIATFEEITTSSAPVKRAPTDPNQFSNAYIGSSEPRRVTIMVLDSINTPTLDQAYARKEIVKYLSKNLKASDLIALMVMDRRGVHLVHDFSSNPEVLIAALKKVAGSVPNISTSDTAALTNGADTSSLTGSNAIDPTSLDNEAEALQSFMDQSDNIVARFQQAQAIEATFQNFLNIAQAFSGVPGRKSVVWLTGGLPFNLADDGSEPTGRDLRSLYERTFQMMNQANIAVYPVDVRGLVNFGYGNASAPSKSMSSATFATGGSANIMASSALEATNHTNIDDFAKMTGGRAFYNTNDLAASVAQASSDASDYYMLGYYLARKVDRAGWRKLKVKVEYPGAHVMARSGFFVTPATLTPQMDRTYDIKAALYSPLDSTTLPIGVRWLGIVGSDPTKRKVKYAMLALPKTISVDASNPDHFSVDIVVLAKRPDGSDAADTTQTLVGSQVKPEDLPKLTQRPFVHQGELELPPGDYNVRFVMRDNFSGNIGSLSAPLKVPAPKAESEKIMPDAGKPAETEKPAVQK